jgi:hypothetical protein
VGDEAQAQFPPAAPMRVRNQSCAAIEIVELGVVVRANAAASYDCDMRGIPQRSASSTK